MSNTKFVISDDKKAITLERAFEAAQDKLWEALTTEGLLGQWFAPEGWECINKTHDFSEGGEWVYVLRCTDKQQEDFFGMEMPGKLVYDGINPKNSFGYTDYFVGEDGQVDESMPSSHTEVTLSAEEDGTVNIKSVTTYDSPEALQQVLEMGVKEGLEQSYDKLEQLLEK